MALQLADFRAPKDFSERLAAAPKVRSPRGDEDVRLHPEWCWEDALMTKHRGKSFLVTQALSELLAGKMFRASLFAAASSQAGLFIWPVKLNAESAVEAAKAATTRWCCIRWDMNTEQTCPACQQPLPDNAPEGLCPECLMRGGLPSGMEIGTATTTSDLRGSGDERFVPPTVEEIARFFPQLEVLAFIGQGGMGAVYKARQKQLDRVVALRILPPGIGDDAAFAERFAREAITTRQKWLK